MGKIIINPQKIWEILISIYIIGLINIYLIHTYGLEIITGEYKEIFENKINWANFIGCEGILNINENNLLFLIFINILFLLIFNSSFSSLSFYGGLKSIEFLYILSFSLLGLNIIILSNDLIFIFIAIELYSLSVYLLVLLKISKNTSRMAITYLIINSLSSYIFLFGISIIYKYTGSLILEDIKYILNINNNEIYFIYLGISFLLLGILLKLGTVPFNFWVLRLYTILDNRILLYQIILPKLVFVYLLYKFLFFFSSDYYNYFFYSIIFIVSILSVIIASIAGLFHTNFKSILTYSSILNIGFILFGLSNELFKQFNFYGMEYISFFEYLLIYTFNTFSLFFCFLLIPTLMNKGGLFPHRSNGKIISNIHPLFSIFLLFSIFSFIGIPPFAGFYAKLNIFLNLIYSYNPLWMFSIFFLFISTFISACFYLKFILVFFFPLTTTNGNITTTNFLIPNTPTSLSYLFTFFSLFLILYPFISNYLYPFYY